jgi:hypothetical protein
MTGTMTPREGHGPARPQTHSATGHDMNCVVIHPTNWQAIRLGKDNSGQYYGDGPFYGPHGGPQGPASASQFSTAEKLWGMRVVVTSNITVGSALVGAFSTARPARTLVQAIEQRLDFGRDRLHAAGRLCARTVRHYLSNAAPAGRPGDSDISVVPPPRPVPRPEGRGPFHILCRPATRTDSLQTRQRGAVGLPRETTPIVRLAQRPASQPTKSRKVGKSWLGTCQMSDRSKPEVVEIAVPVHGSNQKGGKPWAYWKRSARWLG